MDSIPGKTVGARLLNNEQESRSIFVAVLQKVTKLQISHTQFFCRFLSRQDSGIVPDLERPTLALDDSTSVAPPLLVERRDFLYWVNVPSTNGSGLPSIGHTGFWAPT